MSRRGILLTLSVLLVLTSVAYLIVRSSSEGGDSVATADAVDDTTTSTTRAARRSATTTSTTTTTTTAPTTTSAAPEAVAPATSRPAPTGTSAAPRPTAPPMPPFRSSIGPVTAEELGASYTPGLGCAPPEQLAAVALTHWGMDGQVHDGRIIVAASQAERIVAAFRDVYAAGFPIERMVPVSEYGGDDGASMRANNTSGYNCRTVAGSTKLSNHAFGLAVDVNPLLNPYVRGGTVDPPEGAPWADRRRRDPGMIKADDAVVRAFARQGWEWGGYWSSGKDYQHFSENGR